MLRIALRHPLQLLADQHRRLLVHRTHQRNQVGVGQHHAAITGLGQACKLVGRRAMQPDTAARAAHGLVPVIGVVQGQRAFAIKLRQARAGNLPANEINAFRCALVALFELAHAQLADRDIKTVHQLQAAIVMAQQIQARLAGIDGNDLAHRGRQRQKLRRNLASARQRLGAVHTPADLVLQALELLQGLHTLGAGDGVSHGRRIRLRHQGMFNGQQHGTLCQRSGRQRARLARAKTQQIRVHQLRRLKMRHIGRQAGGGLQGLVQLLALHQRNDLHQALFGIGLAGFAGARCVGLRSSSGRWRAARGQRRTGGHYQGCTGPGAPKLLAKRHCL